ncbi:MAG: response regulator transcription factor [Deltaproteobacteria bacterium]|nr:response regulator transcription factor [Deltaproteobacteria bacterium]
MARNHQILVIDSSLDAIDAIRAVLCRDYEVLTALSGEKALKRAQSERPAAILLAMGLTDMPSLEVCRSLRECPETRDIPILVLDGGECQELREKAFLAGADDFLLRPFHPKELLVRLASKIRRIEEQRRSDEVLKCGNLTLNSSRFEIAVDNRCQRLSVLEFGLLKFLALNRDTVLSRDRILASAWAGGAEGITERTVDSHVVCLRRALVGCDYSITTIYGVGYVFKKP